MVDPGKARLRGAAENKQFNATNKNYTKAYLDGPQMFKTGTSSIVQPDRQHAEHLRVQESHRGAIARRCDELDGARIVESFEERGGGMHNCMTGCIVSVQQHRPRPGRQLQDVRSGVRDADPARRQLRDRELGGRRRPRQAVRRNRPRHHRDGRRDRDPDGLGRPRLGRRRGCQEA